MNQFAFIAILFIAACGIPTPTNGQEVYRCGNAYSHKPCANGVVIDVDDARTPAQKQEADAATQRTAAAAKALEKTRLQEEAQWRAEQARLAAAQEHKGSAETKKPASGSKKPVGKRPPAIKTVKAAVVKHKAEAKAHAAPGSVAKKPKAATSASK